MDMWIKQCDRGVASCYIAQVMRVEKNQEFIAVCLFRDFMMSRIQCSGAVPATISPMIRNAQHNNRSRQE